MDENCHVEPVEKAVTVQQIRAADRAILSVGGMGCPNCAMRIHNSLVAVDGVYRADVYLEFGAADVFYDGRLVSTDILTEAVRRAGNDDHHAYHAVLIAHG
jgi:copper chaperone CopZ